MKDEVGGEFDPLDLRFGVGVGGWMPPAGRVGTTDEPQPERLTAFVFAKSAMELVL